jgi:hypothetical protein
MAKNKEMKTIKAYMQILAGLLAISALAACSKNFLNKSPLDQISSGTFWRTSSDAELGLVGCYQRLQADLFGYSRYCLSGLTDESYHQYDYYGVSDVLVGNLAPTSSLPNTIWTDSYGGISSCNIFLQNIGGVDMDAGQKSTDIGEVHFLRAFFYFELVNFFGDVVMYTTPPTASQADTVSRTPKATVLNLIYSDLDSAIADLADVPYNGHAVKGSAEALKARVYLYNNQWTQAAALCNQIIQSGTFSLYPNYGGQFFAKNQPNSEMIFATNYSAPNDLQGAYGGLDIELGWWASLNPYQAMVNTYETSGGKMITDPTSGYNPASPYANRDPRLLASINVPGQIWYNPDGTIFLPDPSLTTFQAVKYVDTTLLPINYGDINKENEDFVHIRYADVLLMYAEATNEATGPDATVYAAINKVRARVSLPPVDQTLYGSQSTLRTAIRHERLVEFAFEGLRYFDLIRWQIADQVLPQVVTPGGVNGLFPVSHYLMPIPQSERNLDPNLTQNPGYN